MSNIDITKPISGTPTTQSVRDNFSTIKTELEAFQLSSGSSSVGFIQSQAGAVARTVQDIERVVVRTGDFTSSANYDTARALLTERFGAASLDVKRTVTDSDVDNNTVWSYTTDNSPPVSGAGILNTYLSPANRFDVITRSGGVTGSTAVMALVMQDLKGKTGTTLTAGITSSASAQSVAVADSSVFPDNLLPLAVTVGPGLGSAVSEVVTITAKADSTHVTAVFANNHSSGELITLSNLGVKNGLGIALSDAAGNTNSLFGTNPNVTANSAVPGHFVVGGEYDVVVNNGVDSAKYDFDMLTGGPLVAGIGVGLFGANKASYGISVVSGDATCRAWNGIKVEGAAVNNAFLVTNGGSSGNAPVAGLNIQSATTYGVIIGKNQTPATNPVTTLTDPTHGIYLTARGTSGSQFSNNITFESLNSGVAHTFSFRHQNAAGGLFVDYDGTSTGTYFGTDGALNIPDTKTVNFRNSGGSIRMQITAGEASTISPANGGTLTVTATQVNPGIVQMSGRMRLAQGAVVASANDMTLGTDGNYFQISGATQINRITNSNWTGGSEVTLKFNSTPTVKHGQAGSGTTRGIILNGAVDFVAAADNTLTLVYDSTDAKWYEKARKV